jgi:hypothetical protein
MIAIEMLFAGVRQNVATALDLPLIEVDALLDAEYPLAHGIEAFARASAPGALKVQLVMEGGSV